MSLFALNFGNSPDERSEQKALVVALFASLLCIGFFASIQHRFSKADADKAQTSARTLAPTIKFPPAPPPFDLNARYKAVPSSFLQTDFYNHSYGPQRLSDGTKVNVRLEHGSYFYGEGQGWFDIRDLYYVDVTGDGQDEALVRLSHFDCRTGECDGGSSLFYIYSIRNGRLKTLWQFETGTYGYGCGLKSLAVNGKDLVVGMFGEGCPKTEPRTLLHEKYVDEHQTYLHFQYDGQKFVQRQRELVPTTAVSVKDYKPEIKIFGVDVELTPLPPAPSEVRNGKFIYR